VCFGWLEFLFLLLLEEIRQEITLAMELSLPKKDQVVLCKANMTSDTSIMVLLAGVDGFGLDQLHNVIRSMKDVSVVPDTLTALLNEFFVPFSDERKRIAQRQAIKDSLLKLSTAAAGNRLLVSIGSQGAVGLPLPEQFHPLARPDLVELAALFEPFFNVRMVVVTENPLDHLDHLLRVRSKVCPETPVFVRDPPEDADKCSEVAVAARIVEGNLVALSSQLQALTRDFFRVLPFQDALDNPTEVWEAFATFVDFEPTPGRVQQFVSGMAKVAAKKEPRKKLGKTIQRTVDSILTGIREHEWGNLHREELTLRGACLGRTCSTVEQCYVPKLGVTRVYHTKLDKDSNDTEEATDEE